MRVGVVGGAGFIGSHLVDALLDEGHDVTVVDIAAPHRDDVRHVAADITDPAGTAAALDGGYEAVYLLAAMANVNDVFEAPVAGVQTNAMAVAHVLEAARGGGIPRVILASTTWVYTLADRRHADERTPLSVDRANHVYTAAKLSAEMLCRAYHELYGLDVTILRYGIPYGPRARLGTVLATFVNRARQGLPLIVQGDGAQWRTFVYVEDLARGNVAALADAGRNETFNLDGHEPVSVLRVAQRVRDFFPAADIHHVDGRPGDHRPVVVSSDKARTTLGWWPRVSFDEGAERYIRWVLAQRADAGSAPRASGRRRRSGAPRSITTT